MAYLISGLVFVIIVLGCVTLSHILFCVTPKDAVTLWRSGALPRVETIFPEVPQLERIGMIGRRERFFREARCTFADVRMDYAVSQSGRVRLTLHRFGDLLGTRFYYEKQHRFGGYGAGWSPGVIVTPISGEDGRILTQIVIEIRDRVQRARSRDGRQSA